MLPAPHGHHPAGHPLRRGAAVQRKQTEETTEQETGANPAQLQDRLGVVKMGIQEAGRPHVADPVESGGAQCGHLLQAMFSRAPGERPVGAP